jgi:exonuclease SbcD
MTEAIRLLHFADLHIGMENYGRLDPEIGTSSRVRDFLDRLDEVIDHALENEADLVVFAGDAFKNRDPEPTQQREFARRIKRLAETVPTLLLVGNHDMPGMAAKANSVDIFHALDVPGVIVGNAPEGRVIMTRRGPVYAAWIPYPMRNHLLSSEERKGKSIEELEIALGQKMVDILRNLIDQADEHPMPRILVGHFSVAGAEYGSERLVKLGRDTGISLSTLTDPRWDYVALGHIHRHQSLNEGAYPPVVYSGSLERIDFGEETDEKGFCWVELVRERSEWTFLPVKARPFHTIRVDVRQADDPTDAVLKAINKASIDGAIVRVQIRLRVDQEVSLRDRDVEKATSEAAFCSIIRDVEEEERRRLTGLEPETLSPIELVEKYFRSLDVDGDRIKALIMKAEEFIDTS